MRTETWTWVSEGGATTIAGPDESSPIPGAELYAAIIGSTLASLKLAFDDVFVGALDFASGYGLQHWRRREQRRKRKVRMARKRRRGWA